MGNPLLDRRSPQDLAASGQVIEITNKISDFARLAGIIEADLAALDADKIPLGWRDNDVTGSLAFGFAAAHANMPVLEGRVQVTIDAVCQRCLEPARLPLAAELGLLLGVDEGTPGDGGGYEYWELEEETLRPIDLVEEALIMAMPLVAMHDDDVCFRSDDDTDIPARINRPFADLKSQLENDN